jgi:hypothetical protein
MAKLFDSENPDRNISELKEGMRGCRPGWRIRFRVRDIKSISVDVLNSRQGGRDNAIARRVRDAIERELESFLSDPLFAYSHVSIRNNTGVVGVDCVDRPYERNGKKYHVRQYNASWPGIDGTRQKKSFSFNPKERSAEEAKQLAINARLDGLREFNRHYFQTFRPPKRPVKLWRYMDFTKFVSMLQNNGLFFSRASKMNDLFEGGYSRGNSQLQDYVNRALMKALGDAELSPDKAQERRDQTVMSCWHASNHESAAMWRLYSSSNESICIQTTSRKLRQSMPAGIDIGTVQYIDYETEWVPERQPVLPFLYKRKSFEHEREFRAIGNILDPSTNDLRQEESENGLWIKCELEDLIERVRVAPDVAPWFRDLVVQTVNKYELNIPVEPSSLELKPLR